MFNNLEYHELFQTEKEKAEAFDLIAERYYHKNFGTMTKSDLDVLLFSIFMERVLDVKTDHDLNEFDDYTMSKVLGVTQSRISALKEKKQLQYPRDYNWKKAFTRILGNARYERKKIRMYISDKNLYLEVKHAIEIEGGYLDHGYSRNLLSIAPFDFIDLILLTWDSEDRKQAIQELKGIVGDYNDRNESDLKILDTEPLGAQFKDCSLDILVDILSSVSPFGSISERVLQQLRKNL